MSSSYEMGEHFPERGAGTIPAAPPIDEVIWVACSWCAGQRRYIREGFVYTCHRCMGIGEVPIRT